MAATIDQQVIRGVDLLLYAGEVAIGGQKDVTISCNADTIDVSCKTSGDWYVNIAGAKQWSCSCEGFICPSDEGYAAAFNAFMEGTKVTAVVKNTANTLHLEGGAFITQFEISATYTDAVTYSIQLSGAGALENKLSASPAS